MRQKKSGFQWLVLAFVGMAVLMNLTGGIGTSCVAFNTHNYPAYSSVLPYQWLWQTFVITTTLVGLVGIWVILQMGKGKKNSYRNALIMVTLGAIIGGTHMYFSSLVIGKAVPANVKFFANVLALIILLLLNIPSLQKHKEAFENGQRGDKTIGMGITAHIVGLGLMTMPIWAGPSHTINGYNFVNALGTEIKITGILLVSLGTGLLCGKLFPPWYGKINTDPVVVKPSNQETE